jgi:hypothetical protein
MYRIPVKFWVYRSTDGSPGGDYPLPEDIDFQNMTDALNNAFRNNNIQIGFYMINDIGYVDNDDYLTISTFQAYNIGPLHRLAYAVNIHIVNELTDAGGVTSSYPEHHRHIFLERAVYDTPRLSTVPHEAGHYFMLEHTFRYTDKDIKCLREPVTRGFKWTLCPGPIPVYQKRCLYTGDFLCGTPADPKMKAVEIDENCNWTCNERCYDQYDELYAPDVHNIMAYGNLSCRTHFSYDQKNVMIFSASISPTSGNWAPVIANNFDYYEPDNTANTARNINIGEIQEHSFHNSDNNLLNVIDDDWVTFDVSYSNNGAIFEITTSENGSPRPDTKITLYKEDNGNLQYITHDQDSNGNGFSKIEISLDEGIYFIKVDVPYNGLGKYFLSLKACVPKNNCVDDIIHSGETLRIAGLNTVSLPCNNQFIAENGADIYAKSGNCILLKPGFKVNQGGNFSAIITDNLSCNDNDIAEDPKFLKTEKHFSNNVYHNVSGEHNNFESLNPDLNIT